MRTAGLQPLRVGRDVDSNSARRVDDRFGDGQRGGALGIAPSQHRLWGLGGAKPPPQGFEAFFRKNYHAVAVLAAVGEDSS